MDELLAADTVAVDNGLIAIILLGGMVLTGFLAWVWSREDSRGEYTEPGHRWTPYDNKPVWKSTKLGPIAPLLPERGEIPFTGPTVRKRVGDLRPGDKVVSGLGTYTFDRFAPGKVEANSQVGVVSKTGTLIVYPFADWGVHVAVDQEVDARG